MDDFYIQWPGVASNGLRFVQWPRPCPIAVGSLSDRPIAVGRPSNGVRPTRSIWPIPPTISLKVQWRFVAGRAAGAKQGARFVPMIVATAEP